MSKSLKQLQEENEKLRKIILARQKKEDATIEQNRLLRQNKQLLRQIKYKKTLRFAQGAEKIATGTGRIGLKLGKGIFRGLQKLEQQRLKNESLNRKISRVVKKKSPSKVKKRKKR